MSEIWKDIPGYEGLYQISNIGKVGVTQMLSENIKTYAPLH